MFRPEIADCHRPAELRLFAAGDLCREIGGWHKNTNRCLCHAGGEKRHPGENVIGSLSALGFGRRLTTGVVVTNFRGRGDSPCP